MTHATREGASTGATYPHLVGVGTSGVNGAPQTVPFTMTASDTTPATGQESSGGVESSERRVWRCRFCGLLRSLRTRPTECYHCRRGEHEFGDTRLFESVSVVAVSTDGGEPSE